MRVPKRIAAVAVGLAFFAAACAGTGASRQSLIDILVEENGLEREDATCVSNALYATPGLTEDDINDGSVIRTLDDDASEENRAKFERYQSAVDTAVRQCLRS